MKIILDVFLILLVGYYTFRFVRLLLKLKKGIIFPLSEEMLDVRIFPMRPVALPIFSKQKASLIIYTFMLVFLMVMISFALRSPEINWSFYFMSLLPLLNSHNLLNVFAINDDGIMRGARFIPWKNITAFRFVPIDVNHRFYGYGDEVNSGHELIVRGRFFSISTIVTTVEMKKKITNILSQRVDGNIED
ncbi:hypothetical protein FZW96_14230 [Bacillus sp. BGMRC 2118]|nr:hypothetical protein FZW96_14230 [Bacillus sp. BGMRC 2118]